MSAGPDGGPPSVAQEAHSLVAAPTVWCEEGTKTEQGKHVASPQTHLSCIFTSAS